MREKPATYPRGRVRRRAAFADTSEAARVAGGSVIAAIGEIVTGDHVNIMIIAMIATAVVVMVRQGVELHQYRRRSRGTNSALAVVGAATKYVDRGPRCDAVHRAILAR